MDASFYKFIQTRRGLEYCYFHLSASPGKPTLLFLHGFPSNSHGWHHQVQHFKLKGYGIIAPDMLGFGRTSKPLDPRAFKMNLLAADIIDVLNAGDVDKVVGIGHDWGCIVMSRLSMLYPERFYAFAWLGLSFMEPQTQEFDLDQIMSSMKQLLGYEGYSYWKFFDQVDAPVKIEKHVDSFLQLLYPKDPECWRVYMALPGKTQEWIEQNSQPGRAEYIAEEYEALRFSLLSGGIRSPLNWYKCEMGNHDLEDNLNIPQEKWQISKPSFFAAALKDCICTPLRGKACMARYGREVKVVDFMTGHWVHLEAPENLNQKLEAWLYSLSLYVPQN